METKINTRRLEEIVEETNISDFHKTQLLNILKEYRKQKSNGKLKKLSGIAAFALLKEFIEYIRDYVDR